MIPASPPIIANRYRLLDLLGEGGMGTVYRAYDRLTGREVALKQLRPVTKRMFTKTSTSEEQQDALLRLAVEFRTMVGLRHPHIAAVLSYGFAPTDTGQAEPYFTLALQQARQIGALPILVEIVVGWAWLRLHQHQPQTSAALLGAAEAHPAMWGKVRDLYAVPLRAELAALLSSDALHTALAQGAAAASAASAVSFDLAIDQLLNR